MSSKKKCRCCSNVGMYELLIIDNISILKSFSIIVSLKTTNTDSEKLCKNCYNTTVNNKEKIIYNQTPILKSSPMKRRKSNFNLSYKYSLFDNNLFIKFLEQAILKCIKSSNMMKLSNLQEYSSKSKYPNLKNIPYNWIRSHFVWAATNNDRTFEDHYDKWIRFYIYLVDIKKIDLTEVEINDLILEQNAPHWIQDFKKFQYGKYTSLSESFHSLVNIYIKKGKNYKISVYQSRHYLAVLHNHELIDESSKITDPEEKVVLKWKFIHLIKEIYFNKINNK